MEVKSQSESKGDLSFLFPVEGYSLWGSLKTTPGRALDERNMPCIPSDLTPWRATFREVTRYYFGILAVSRMPQKPLILALYSPP